MCNKNEIFSKINDTQKANLYMYINKVHGENWSM